MKDIIPAGNQRDRKLKFVSTPPSIKDPFFPRFDSDFLPTGNHIIKCESKECPFCDKKFNVCLYISSKCCMEDYKGNFIGVDKRVIIRKDK